VTFNTGTRIGPYEILSALGSGAMGDVYRARDTRLHRTVAIKVLSAELAGDHDLRARFEREARTIAALDHPHICAVYDVGEQDGVHYLVMPHLEGETLAERVARAPRGLPLPEVLAIGGQIADALDKTHRAGITHRDLKPANIMLTKAGAKLLDFGVAKLRPAAPVSTSTELATATCGTASGTVLGTVPYMAPEQLEGRDADARSDIWAFGTVLFEMATGARPFGGDSPAATIGAILKDDAPRVSAQRPLVPPALDHLVEHCLAKDPDERWQSAADLYLHLKWIETARDAAAPPPVSRRHRILVPIAGFGAVLVAAATAALFSNPSGVVAADPMVATVARVTHEAGSSEWPTWSPDGSLFAFTSDRDGNFDLYVGRAEGGREVVNVTN
jgi:serine/threonine protein kinase